MIKCNGRLKKTKSVKIIYQPIVKEFLQSKATKSALNKKH